MLVPSHTFHASHTTHTFLRSLESLMQHELSRRPPAVLRAHFRRGQDAAATSHGGPDEDARAAAPGPGAVQVLGHSQGQAVSEEV